MEDYNKELEEQYQEEKQYYEDIHAPHKLSKLDFLSISIFDFTTYDSEMDIKLSKRMIEVIECILQSTTHEYQKKNYENYILMVNMPFLVGKLEWGTSIRGAWFATEKDINELRQMLDWAKK